MDPDTVSLVAAVVFLLIAVLGGGFSAKELVVPQVPIWGRIVSACLRLAFAAPFILHQDGSSADSRKDAEKGESNSNTARKLYSDTTFDTSPEQLQLSDLEALGRRDPPKVGDRLTIKFTLDNIADRPMRLASTFIAARDPARTNRDYAEGHYGIRFVPGKIITVSRSIILDSAGTWEFWPCYTFERNGRERYCPEEWQSFEVVVRP
jgi:hypothetical protein